MRVFVPAVQQGNEWVSPVDEVSGFDRLRIEDCASVVDRWVPERVRIIREDEGFRLAVADVPWLGNVSNGAGNASPRHSSNPLDLANDGRESYPPVIRVDPR